MTSPPVTAKRRSLVHTPSSEDQQLNIIAQEVSASQHWWPSAHHHQKEV